MDPPMLLSENFPCHRFGQDLKPKVFNDLLQSANIEEISPELFCLFFVFKGRGYGGCGLEDLGWDICGFVCSEGGEV